MKKWTALLLAGILTLSLSGCAESARSLGGRVTETEVYANVDESAAPDESVIPDEKVSEEAAKEQSGDKADQSTAEEAAKDKVDDEKNSSDKADDGKNSSDKADDGKNSSDKADDVKKNSNASDSEAEKTIQKVYLQENFGYRLVLDEDWEFANDKELQELNQDVAKEAEGEEAFAKIVEADNIYTDMVANDTVTGNSITVKLIKIGLADVIGSEEERNEVLADALYAEAEAAGLKKLQKSTKEVDFLGEKVTAIGVKGDLALSDDYTTEMWYQMIVKQKGQYASVIFVTGFTEFSGDNFQKILDKFEAVE